MVYPDTTSSPSSIASSSSRPCRPILKSKSKSLSLPPLPHHSHTSPNSPPRAAQRPFRPFTPLIMPSSDHVLSPSKLPCTDVMSYFPPFEDMGSQAEEPEAGPSRPTSRREKEHGKNKSLGSLVGFMAWATFSPTSEAPPGTRPISSPIKSRGMARSTSSGAGGQPPLSDGAKLQALTRRFTNGGGKRRVLEPMAVENNQIDQRVSLMGLTTVQPKAEGKKQKRRMGSEMEVDKLLRPKGGQMEEGGAEHEERAVERMIGWTPAREAQPSHLPLPPPYLQLPNWRFPIPSPPITSLSPHIPLELFQYEISNPASAGSSPSKAPTSAEYSELEEIEGTLLAGVPDSGLKSGAGSLSSGDSDSALSHPVTPPRTRDREPTLWTSDIKQSYGIRRGTPTLDENDVGGSESEEDQVERLEMLFRPERLKLRRTSSSGSKASCDSSQTLRAKEGDMTPRLGRGYRAIQGI